MRELLDERIRAHQHTIALTRRLLDEAKPVHELIPFRDRLDRECALLTARCNQVIRGLSIGPPEVQSYLRQVGSIGVKIQILNELCVPALLRPANEERITLRLLRWLHQRHPATAGFPAASIDGPPGTHAVPEIGLAVYRWPLIEHRRLLYQPLLIHEYGHWLFALC